MIIGLFELLYYRALEYNAAFSSSHVAVVFILISRRTECSCPFAIMSDISAATAIAF